MADLIWRSLLTSVERSLITSTIYIQILLAVTTTNHYKQLTVHFKMEKQDEKDPKLMGHLDFSLEKTELIIS